MFNVQAAKILQIIVISNPRAFQKHRINVVQGWIAHLARPALFLSQIV